MPSPRIVGAKIVQIATVGGGAYVATLFVLDDNGRVWRAKGDGDEATLRTTWQPISFLPIGEPAPTDGEAGTPE